jgi:GntR family transcriptional regulator/MocR family aminotransferase
VLLEEGEQVWIEDPAYNSAYQAFLRAGVKPISVRVDEEGFSLSSALAITSAARLAFITPSRQYPLGQTMSLSRRLALIDWARSNNAWLVEDDYDSEFRYRGQPLQPLAARDGFERTIYLGSFSKVMFPALRLSYIVAPKALVKPLLAVFQTTGKQASILAQPALAEFMASGQFAQHIRRMRRLYAKRHAALGEALEIYGSDLFDVTHYDSGMHMVAHFKAVLSASLTDIEAVEHLRRHHLISSALSQFFQTNPKPHGLILGFAAVPVEEIAPNVKRLTDLLREMV